MQPLVTHRLPGRELKAGYDLLYEHPEQGAGRAVPLGVTAFISARGRIAGKGGAVSYPIGYNQGMNLVARLRRSAPV